MSKSLTNTFFDINKLPPKEGILVFPISMSRISNAQTPNKCWEYVQIFSPNKIVKPLVGVNFIYGDYLYLNSDERANVLKRKFMPLVLQHKHGFKNIIAKNPYYIDKAFSYTTWNQLLLEAKDFVSYLGELKKIYAADKKLQKYLRDDAEAAGRNNLDSNQINFFLEESLVMYLMAKGRIRMRNDYILDTEKWLLWCYPGKPLKTQIYLFQKNFFKLANTNNEYENAYYDLAGKRLYDFLKIDLRSLIL